MDVTVRKAIIKGHEAALKELQSTIISIHTVVKFTDQSDLKVSTDRK